MIRNAVIHLLNEQPLLADLLERPAAGHVTLVCTNLRTTNGRRPVFVDDEHSVFVFPYAQIRFVEMPDAAAGEGSGGGEELAAAPAGGPGERGADGPGAGPDADLDGELELDEDFLRRIREV